MIMDVLMGVSAMGCVFGSGKHSASHSCLALSAITENIIAKWKPRHYRGVQSLGEGEW